MSDTVLLQARGITKGFPVYSGIFRRQVGLVQAVAGVDIDIPEKKVVGLVGESGCGKSTLARILLRLIPPTEGSIVYQGQNILSFQRKSLLWFRRRVQIVFQDPQASLNPRKSIGESLREPLRFHGLVENENEEEEKAAQMLQQVGLSGDFLARYPHELSGGQQQRVCIGRAMLLEPEVLICDEAVSALDVSVQAQILNLLLDLKESRGLSFLFVSHDLSVVRHMADTVLVMHQGKIIERGETEQIYEDPQEEYTRTLLRSVPIAHPRERHLVFSSNPI